AALAAVLLSRQEHQAIFDHAFDVFWRNPRLLEKTIARLLPKVTGRAVPGHGLPSRIAQALQSQPPRDPSRNGDDEVRFDATFTFSPRDVLRCRAFETMTGDELAEVRQLLARLRLPLPESTTRRTTPDRRGPRIDLRAPMRRATGGAGALAPLARRDRRRR